MFNNRVKEDKPKKVVKLREKNTQRYKEEIGKEKHNVSVLDE